VLIYNEEHLKHILEYLMFIISCNLQIYYILSIFFIKIKDETLNTLCVCQNIYLCFCVIVLYLVCPMLAVSVERPF